MSSTIAMRQELPAGRRSTLRCASAARMSVFFVFSAGNTEEFDLLVKYQACSNDRCEPPKTLTLKGKVEVAPADEKVKSINDKLFNPRPATKKN